MSRFLVGAVVLVLLASACDSGGSHHAASAAAPTAPVVTAPTIVLPAVQPARSDCALSLANDAITGAHATASAIGWEGNSRGVVTCLGGRFYTQDLHQRAYGFGIYAGGPTTWTDAEGYLPAQITSFRRDGAQVTITEFADRVLFESQPFVNVYARVAVRNPTNGTIVADPFPTPGLVPLTTAPAAVPPGGSTVHDYAVTVDRFHGGAAYPLPRKLVAAGGFDEHYRHMRAYWIARLKWIAQVDVPDQALADAYRAGFIYTMIARSGQNVNTGVNNYEAEYSHDVIGIATSLFTEGDYDPGRAHLLLDVARLAIYDNPEYLDAVWTYPWLSAVYLMKTGDFAYVKRHFAGAGAPPTSIEQSAHAIAAARTGPGGIIGITNDIDSNGYWTVDDYEALTGLAAYRYIAHAVGDAAEERWAAAEYTSLLDAVNTTLRATTQRYHIDYLPCSLVQPNTANRCRDPRDANWAAPFLFGRWVWDAPLFGAKVDGLAAQLVDATYAYGFGRLRGVLPPDTFGGYPSNFYSTGYNAGYGSGALAGTRYRDEGIRAFEFMIAHTQSGPYSWWESMSSPSPSPWIGDHPASGGGSSPHAWGIANADKVLLDSLAAQESDGTLIVGRGVPSAWLANGKSIAVTNFPTTDGRRIALRITTQGRDVTLTLQGSHGAVQFELPAFVGNIASATVGAIDQTDGMVQIGGNVRSVTVRLRRAPA